MVWGACAYGSGYWGVGPPCTYTSSTSSNERCGAGGSAARAPCGPARGAKARPLSLPCTSPAANAHTLPPLSSSLPPSGRVEEPFNRCLQAADAEAAATEWDAICDGLRRVNACLIAMGKGVELEGPFFYGGNATAAEAATAPTLFRMLATLPAVRDLELVSACRELRLERLLTWLTAILERPDECCEVRALPPDVYVELARKMHVRFEGPPMPGGTAPRASFADCSSSGSLATVSCFLSSYLPGAPPAAFISEDPGFEPMSSGRSTIPDAPDVSSHFII